MKKVVYNYDHLKEDEIDNRVIRVKALMINSKKEILLGEAFGTLQFPGGHLEEGETLDEALKREIREETGILLKENYEPYFSIQYFLKDFPVTGNNRSIEIYYYVVLTNESYHLENIYLDDKERRGDFHLMYVPLKNVKKVLKKSIPNNPLNEMIVDEMLIALKYYRKGKAKWKQKDFK